MLLRGPQVTADLSVVCRVVGIIAERHLAEPDVMVGDRHEIERSAQLALNATGKRDSLTATVAVGGARVIAIAEAVGVQRIAGVHVQIAEVGIAQRIRRRT